MVRPFAFLVVCWAAFSVIFSSLHECRAAESSASSKTFRAYIGTYADAPQRGIFMATFDAVAGEFGPLELAVTARHPSFLAIHPNQKFLYAVGETDDFNRQKSGAVSAFAIDPQSGKLSHLNSQPSEGAAPCHIIVDRPGNYLLVANYNGGNIASLPIDENGHLKAAVSVIAHAPHAAKNQTPHAHSINLDRANRFAIVADLGLDRLFVYRFQPDTGKLAVHDPPYTALAPGAGPRHFAFHTSEKFAYAINESDCTISACAYNASEGTLRLIQSISTLPEKRRPQDSTAEIVVHPSGKFLYGSNRGHDSIAIFAIDEKTGRLTALGNRQTGGKTPRNFVIDPTGKWLLAENQNSDSITIFRIDQETGLLAPTKANLAIQSPVCIRFLPLAN